MRRTLAVITLCLGLTTPAAAESSVYSVGLHGGFTTLTGGVPPKTGLHLDFGLNAGYSFRPGWTLELDLAHYDLPNDTLLTSSFSFGSGEDDATAIVKAYSLAFTLNRRLLSEEARLNASVGLGAGMLLWKAVDPETDDVLKVLGPNGENTDYKASELFIRLKLGLEGPLSHRFSLSGDIAADYLTGAGADFAEEVNSARDRLLIGAGLTLRYGFGHRPEPKKTWPSETSWATLPSASLEPDERLLDSDGDGVPDKRDRCLNTPAGAVVDRDGCPLDSDRDGVPDGFDDCPGTDPMAADEVDIFGCPIDADFDGIPDYRDRCPSNDVGAVVDAEGCPIDADADGVPDGLDDCPYTLYGVDVDRRGCIDLSIFDKPMVLNIDYTPGSFEVDPTNQERIKRLARLLLFVTDIQLEVSGYTDNIGMPDANKTLSEKRANRVRDYLVAQGIDTQRIKVFGRGESNFVASNDTTEGRALNRRVEIVFIK